MKYVLWIVAFLSGGVACGQHTELSVQVGSGLFSFGGPGAVNETYLNVSDTSGPPILANPYGRANALSYSLTGQVQRITKAKFIYGIQTGYERMTSRVAITRAIGGFTSATTTNGYATLKNQFVNLKPFVGKRFGSQRIHADLTVGVDIGIGISSHEYSQLMGTTGYFPTTDMTRPIPAIDFRPRLSLTGYYHAFGLSLGYSHGLTNYTTGQYGNDGAYSRFWRAGVVYRFGGHA